MCRSAQRYPGNKLGKLLKNGWLLLAGLSLTQICVADSSTPPSWTKGPARVSLGDYGQVDLPAGYKFTDGQSAASLLKIAPTGSGRLVGVIMPIAAEFSPRGISGDWYMAFEYSDLGHVNDMVEWQINDDEVLASLQPRVAELNKVRETRGQPPLAKAVWQIKPTYKVERRSIEWALRGDGVSTADTVLDYANRFLTRRGVLEARATVYKGGTVAVAWIQDLVAALNIKRGEGYQDFRAGDKTTSVGLATIAKEIPAGSNVARSAVPAATARAGVENVGGMKAFWIIIGALGCVGIVGGGLLARRLRYSRGSQDGESTEEVPAQVPTEAAALVAASNGNGNGNGNGHPNGNGHANGLKLNGHGLKFGRSPKPARARGNGNGAVANGNGNGNGKDMKRKRMFNYHKFYTEMVLQGPSPVVADNYSAYDLDLYTAAHVNGYGNNSNGNSQRNHGNNGNGHSNGNVNGNGNSGSESNGNGSNAMLTAAHNELIATQRGLIEEQKRLIQEQGRLIEEKAKLLAEKDRLIERQAQRFDNPAA